jgi:hypothetical protein
MTIKELRNILDKYVEEGKCDVCVMYSEDKNCFLDLTEDDILLSNTNPQKLYIA